jgi:murein DD-endopeptidase MepM/ murein hydrolase activator NlpD
MLWLFAALAVAAQTPSPDCLAIPKTVPQGWVIRASCPGATAARMNGRKIELFAQQAGPASGLMPVPVLEKPGEYSLEFLRQDEDVIATVRVAVTDAHYPKQNVTIAASTAELKPSPGEQDTVTAFRTAASPERFWTDRLLLPEPGCLTSRFGVQRYFNGKPTADFHAGLDQRGATGTPIHAVAGGVVKIVQNFNLRGGTVAIDHGQGLESIYMHMSKTAANEGEHVKAGDVIGYVGATGRANGPHLHWTLYANGVPVNPAQWLKVPQSCYAAKAGKTSPRAN